MSTAPVPPSEPLATPAPPVTASKRKYLEAIAQLGEPAIPVPKKRAKRDALENKSGLDVLKTAAQFLIRCVNLYLDIGLVLHYGSQARWAPPSPTDPTLSTDELEDQALHIAAFTKMVTGVPAALELMHEFFLADNWDCLLKTMRKAALQTRQNDTAGLKYKLSYLVKDPQSDPAPVVSLGESKSDRGVNHVVLRGYLVPVKVQQKLLTPAPAEGEEEEDIADTTLKGLVEGTIKLTYKKWPACFYADDSYDPSDPQKGLFRSEFLLRITQHIWTAPSSAFNGATSLKRVSNARAAGAFQACPEMIAYSCAQGRTMISASEWARKEGNYDYVKMYDKVIKLFTDHPADPWAIETLAWYTKNVFATHRANSGTGADDASDDDDGDSDDEVIKAQRAARCGGVAAAS